MSSPFLKTEKQVIKYLRLNQDFLTKMLTNRELCVNKVAPGW